ncbi:MAG: FAD-dependent oxidoreductase [Candidatus Paceibacterota bacterium]
MIYDLAIIGGGPAGAAAAVYAARKRLHTVIITKDWLGQSSVSEKIENWIGSVAISGTDLSKNLENHVKAYAKEIIDIKEGEGCIDISANIQPPQSLIVKTEKNEYSAKTILIASGSHRRKLDILGADKYEHKGLTYCATCDGPMYSDQDVVVIGGGNAAFESAAQLMAYCKSVTIMNRSEKFKADPGTIEIVSKNPKVKVLTMAVPKEVIGDKFVTSMIYTDMKTKKDIKIKTTGIFVEIGSLPNTDFAKNTIKLDSFNRIPVDAKNQQTAVPGIWSAGDCTDGLYHQNNIAAGDAVKAIEDIYSYLKAR